MEPRARLALSALDVICLRFSSSLSGGFDSRYFPTYFFAVKGGGKVGHVGGSIVVLRRRCGILLKRRRRPPAWLTAEILDVS